MAVINPILTTYRGKAHSVALGVICALMVVQVSAMVRAVWLAKSKNAAPADAQTSSAQPPGAPPLPAGVQAAPKLMAPPLIPVPSPAAQQPPAMTSAKTKIPDAPAQSLDPELLELIDTAQQLRPLGDLKGALDVLHHADTQWPDHPAVLAEMAQTYELMGLAEKAAAARQKLAGMGATAGVSVQAPLTGGSSLPPSTGLTTPESLPGDPVKMLRIGPCELIRDRSMARGEKVTLRLPIQSRPGQVIDPSVMDIQVFFFDLVNGEKIEQTKADEPVNTWVDAPVDWRDGQERLDVVYSMPEMTNEVIRGIGLRKFHGYIVKLYYQDKLQDTVMEPESLQNFGTGSASQTTGNPLLPPATR